LDQTKQDAEHEKDSSNSFQANEHDSQELKISKVEIDASSNLNETKVSNFSL
jgi:hypothetical protein